MFQKFTVMNFYTLVFLNITLFARGTTVFNDKALFTLHLQERQKRRLLSNQPFSTLNNDLNRLTCKELTILLCVVDTND